MSTTHSLTSFNLRALVSNPRLGNFFPRCCNCSMSWRSFEAEISQRGASFSTCVGSGADPDGARVKRVLNVWFVSCQDNDCQLQFRITTTIANLQCGENCHTLVNGSTRSFSRTKFIHCVYARLCLRRKQFSGGVVKAYHRLKSSDDG